MTRLQRQEILHIRHHSLYTPADFDLSPYFKVIKPTIQEGFNYKGLRWAEDPAAGGGQLKAAEVVHGYR
jgi:hypothetical protein